MAHDAKRLGKTDEVGRQSEETRENPPMDARDVAPVSTRRKLWYVVRAGLAIAFLWLLLWIGVMETVRVMKSPPPCPENPLSKSFAQLAYGMGKDEVCAVVDKYETPTNRSGWGWIPSNGHDWLSPPMESYVLGVLAAKEVPSGHLVASHTARDGFDLYEHPSRSVRWYWVGDADDVAGGRWYVELVCCFDDAKGLILAECRKAWIDRESVKSLPLRFAPMPRDKHK